MIPEDPINQSDQGNMQDIKKYVLYSIQRQSFQAGTMQRNAMQTNTLSSHYRSREETFKEIPAMVAVLVLVVVVVLMNKEQGTR